TVVDGLPKDHRLLKEELFVPIVCIAEVSSLEEAIKLSNDVDYGLTAGIFSEDRGEIEKFFDEIQTGVLYANRKVGATTGAMVGAQPFVGWKLSGSSGKGAGGIYYLTQFLREQSQTIAS
ncbi:MAG: aldehyde dehydrogenase family protein, partial [Nitrososphaerales archaeon]|nr:aldehyde dehydrogenase family protein [Nitrososphaerales archaeon]